MLSFGLDRNTSRIDMVLELVGSSELFLVQNFIAPLQRKPSVGDRRDSNAINIPQLLTLRSTYRPVEVVTKPISRPSLGGSRAPSCHERTNTVPGCKPKKRACVAQSGPRQTLVFVYPAHSKESDKQLWYSPSLTGPWGYSPGALRSCPNRIRNLLLSLSSLNWQPAVLSRPAVCQLFIGDSLPLALSNSFSFGM